MYRYCQWVFSKKVGDDGNRPATTDASVGDIHLGVPQYQFRCTSIMWRRLRGHGMPGVRPLQGAVHTKMQRAGQIARLFALLKVFLINPRTSDLEYVRDKYGGWLRSELLRH